MMRKTQLILLVVLVVVAAVYANSYGETDLHHDLDAVNLDAESVSLAEIADQVASYDNVFSQFISEDEDDEKDDFDDDKLEEEKRRREAKERRREIQRIRAERRAKARLARGPVYNGGNATMGGNATNAVNATTTKPKRRHHQFNKKFLDAKEKRMLKETHRLERIARRERARAAAHGATAAVLRSIHKENKAQAKLARDNGKITYELRSAVDAMNTVKNDMERDDIQDDALFWDAFYGKKAHPNVTTPTQPEIIMQAQQQAEAGKKAETQFQKDMALPIYKVSHVASFEEAYGRSKKVPKLDDSLKEDGEKYLSYISLFN